MKKSTQFEPQSAVSITSRSQVGAKAFERDEPGAANSIREP